ncbi:MAG: hypothetical protein KatS3mg057_1819 [Herpetosiphonaceae bacterium]|nr:MAG: hypothetical protein KatS3mg057_1819 [Herpetosiphonaceae bacterium]
MHAGCRFFRRPDGRLQLGLGARGWSFDPASLSLGVRIEPPWERIGSVPLVAVGGVDAEMLARQLVEQLHRLGRSVALGAGGFDAARAAMADERAEVVVVPVDPAMVLHRGLPFDFCTVAIVGRLAGLDQAAERAAGLHALTAQPDGGVILNADDSTALALVDRVGAPVTLVSEEGLTEALSAHLAAGGRGVWPQAGLVMVAEGSHRNEIDAGERRPALLTFAAIPLLL